MTKRIIQIGFLGMTVAAVVAGAETPFEAAQCLYDGAFLTALVECIVRNRLGIAA